MLRGLPHPEWLHLPMYSVLVETHAWMTSGNAGPAGALMFL